MISQLFIYFICKILVHFCFLCIYQMQLTVTLCVGFKIAINKRYFILGITSAQELRINVVSLKLYSCDCMDLKKMQLNAKEISCNPTIKYRSKKIVIHQLCILTDCGRNEIHSSFSSRCRVVCSMFVFRFIVWAMVLSVFRINDFCLPLWYLRIPYISMFKTS